MPSRLERFGSGAWWSAPRFNRGDDDASVRFFWRVTDSPAHRPRMERHLLAICTALTERGAGVLFQVAPATERMRSDPFCVQPACLSHSDAPGGPASLLGARGQFGGRCRSVA